MSFSASNLMSANVAIVIMNVWAAALFVASRLQMRKEVQRTAARCNCTGLQQQEPPDDKYTASTTVNSPMFGISGLERCSKAGPESSQRHADHMRPPDSTSSPQPRNPFSSSHTKFDLIIEGLNDSSSYERQRHINRVCKRAARLWRKLRPTRGVHRKQLCADAIALGRQMEELPPLFGELFVRQPKPYLLLLPAELKAMILRNLTSFQDLQSLTQAIAAYHVVAERDNIFTEATMNELESRNTSFLPRDLALPDTRIVHSLSIYVRIPDYTLEKYKQSKLLQAVEAYVWNHNSNGKHLRFTIEQCLAILSVLEVDHWTYCLSAKPGPLTKDVNEPRERIYLFHDYATGVYLDVANNSGPYIEEDATREKILLLIIKKIRKRSTSIGHIHNLCLSPTPSIVSYRELCDKRNFSALRN